ncbi:MAG: hypothetical protein ACHBMF_09220 [Chromatiales bacterium]
MYNTTRGESARVIANLTYRSADSVRHLLTLACLAGTVALVSPQEVRAHGGDASLVHACIGNRAFNQGITRIVGPNASCLAVETPRHWAVQGPAGTPGPAGPEGAAGPAGPQGGPAGPPGPGVPETSLHWVNIYSLQASTDPDVIVSKALQALGMRITSGHIDDLQWVETGVPVPPGYLVTGVRLCYRLSNSRSFISQIRLAQVQDPPAPPLSCSTTELT